MDSLGPSRAELEALVTGLSPRRELVARMAMRGVFDQCRVDGGWKARIDELMAGLSPDELAEVQEQAKATARRLTAITARA